MVDEALKVTLKPYQKPEMSEVELFMDDAVLGGSNPDSLDPLSVLDL